MAKCNKTTKLLMSAAHLYYADLYYYFKEREEHPYKAPAPEYGIDPEKIEQELKASGKINLIKNGLLVFFIITSIILFFVTSLSFTSTLILMLLLNGFTEFWRLIVAKKRVRAIMETDDFSCNYDDDSSKNVIISGGYSPFIGAGNDMESWSFTVDLNKPENDHEPVQKVDPLELYNAIERDLKDLNLEDMTFKDELFINGKDVNMLERLLPQGRFQKPVETLDQEYILNKINQNEPKERYYKTVRIPLWDGQIYLSVYYRFLVLENTLFTEAKFFMLPPLKKKYLNISNIPTVSSISDNIRDLLKSILFGIRSLGNITFRFNSVFPLVEYNKGVQLQMWKKEVETNRLYNYGWQNSLREACAEEGYERYFQSVDQDLTFKILTNEFLKTQRDFLTRHNVSTDRFNQTTTKIINHGVMVSGGQVQVGTLAAGIGAGITQKITGGAQ